MALEVLVLLVDVCQELRKGVRRVFRSVLLFCCGFLDAVVRSLYSFPQPESAN